MKFQSKSSCVLVLCKMQSQQHVLGRQNMVRYHKRDAQERHTDIILSLSESLVTASFSLSVLEMRMEESQWAKMPWGNMQRLPGAKPIHHTWRLWKCLCVRSAQCRHNKSSKVILLPFVTVLSHCQLNMMGYGTCLCGSWRENLSLGLRCQLYFFVRVQAGDSFNSFSVWQRKIWRYLHPSGCILLFCKPAYFISQLDTFA